MKVIRPLLPKTENGRILADWDLKYDADSLGATLFEYVYDEVGVDGCMFGLGTIEQVRETASAAREVLGLP